MFFLLTAVSWEAGKRISQVTPHVRVKQEIFCGKTAIAGNFSAYEFIFTSY
jgi:hypothetical protein